MSIKSVFSKSALLGGLSVLCAAAASPALASSGGGGGGGGGITGGGANGNFSAVTRGPNPTAFALEQDNGPYNVNTINVSSFVSGFGGGTIFYPTNAGGDMGLIAVVPGFVSEESSIIWWGQRLASWGFVVITIDTNSGFDQPDSRATQLGAALDYVIDRSESGSDPLFGLVDPNRLGAVGWSMGGGGSLELSTRRGEVRAIIPQAPYYAGFNDFENVDAATFFIACELDAVAPVATNVSPFWFDVPNSTPKLYVEINNGDHFCANTGNSDEDLLGKIGVSWMKRFIDKDTRFEPFLCPTNYSAQFNVSEQRNNCGF